MHCLNMERTWQSREPVSLVNEKAGEILRISLRISLQKEWDSCRLEE